MAAKKKTKVSREDALVRRAASRGYMLKKEGKAWYADNAGTRYGPMASLDEVDEFLPEEG
jgi:hypothetical protein